MGFGVLVAEGAALFAKVGFGLTSSPHSNLTSTKYFTFGTKGI
jgi:hypothetical protein